MQTQERVNGIFSEMKEALQNNNEAAMEALAENTTESARMIPSEVPLQPLLNTEEVPVKPKPRRRKNDAGIAQNVSNGEKVVEVLITLEDAYNPSNPAISVVSLQAKNVEGNAQINSVRQKKQIRKNTINTRQDIYRDLKPLSKRMRNEMIASGVSKKSIDQATSWVLIIDGHRIIPKKADATDKNYISASHTSFSQQIQNFSGFIELVAGVPEYNPNIPALTVAALTAKRDAMITNNHNVSESDAVWSTALVNRNKFFNAEYTGYIETYVAVKRAVKAIFGGTSAEYKQISKLAFKRIKS